MFRKAALENRKMQWRGNAILLPGIPPWLMTLLSLIFVIALLLFISCATYTRRITVNGEVITWPRAVNVYSSFQGFVVKQFVSEGQAVKKGDPIYQLDVSRSTRSGVVSDNQRRDIQSQLARVESIILRLDENKKMTLQMLEKQKAQYSTALARSQTIRSRAEEGIKIMKHNMENYQQYQSRGLINKDQYINQVALYYQQQNNLLSLNSQNEQNALQVINIESQIHIQAAEFDNRIYQAELQRYELQKELLANDASGEIMIRALSDGTIDSLSVTPGQMVNMGDSLLQIVPEKIKSYYLVIWVLNEAVPYINVGDRVNIRYEAFPAQKFGQFAATLTLISKTPASVQEMLTYQGAPRNSPGTSATYYKVIVRPERQSILYQGKKLPLENGMKAKSTLFLEERKIYQWMFAPFYDMKHSAAGPVSEA